LVARRVVGAVAECAEVDVVAVMAVVEMLVGSEVDREPDGLGDERQPRQDGEGAKGASGGGY